MIVQPDECRAASLQERLNLYEQAMNNMAEGICMFDAHSRLLVSNNKYAEIYELPPELIVAGTLHADIVAYRLGSRLITSS